MEKNINIDRTIQLSKTIKCEPGSMIESFSKSLRTLIAKNTLLFVILILAGALRFFGIYPGYHPYHSDEGMSYSSAIVMIKNLNFDPTRYDYPALIPIINALVFSFLFIPLFIVISFIFNPALIPSFKNPLDLWQRFVIVNQQNIVLFWGRFVTAIFGVGVVLMVYLVANKLFQNKKISLTASFLTAVNFRQVLNSHLALPDIYNAFFLLLAFYAIANMLVQSALKNYFLAGIALALSFSTKFQIFALPAFILAHLSISLANSYPRNIIIIFKNIFSKKALLAASTSLLVIFLINIYFFFNWNAFIDINGYNFKKYAFGTYSFNFYPISYLYHIGIGPILSLFGLGGIIWGIKKYFFQSLLLLSAIIPFCYIFLYFSRGGYYTRNFVTITPFFLIFVSVFVIEILTIILGKFWKKETVSSTVIIVILILIAFDQIQKSVINSYFFSQSWNLRAASKWVKENIPNGVTVITHPWDKYTIGKNFKIISFEMNKVFSLAEIREEGVDYGYLNLDWLTLFSLWWMNRSTEESLRYWNKPDDISANFYAAVATSELASFSIAHFIKPWQAPDMNFIIVKIPLLPEIRQKKQVENFKFLDRESLSNWFIIDGTNRFASSNIRYDIHHGYKEDGAIEIKSASRAIPIIRAISPLIPIKDNKAYLIEGWISSDQAVEKNNRDSYFRIDFYTERPEVIDIKTRSDASTVSSRYYGDGSWQKKEIKVVPPQGAKFMTVSSDVIGDSGRDFWFDDITISESEESFSDPRKISPFIDYHLPNEILFPYSQANM